MTLPKVLIFTPVYDAKDYSFDDWVENTKKLTYPNYDLLIVDNTDDGGKYFRKIKKKLAKQFPKARVERVERGGSSREALARAQNFGRNVFLEGEYDYFFSLESDIFPKPNIIEALMRHGLDVVTALYMIGQPGEKFPDTDKELMVPCITIAAYNEKTGTMGTRLLALEEFLDYMNKGVKQVAAGGWGCSLHYRKAIEKIPFTFVPGHRAHSDVFYFNTCARHKIPVLVDTDILVEHRYSNWDEVKDR